MDFDFEKLSLTGKLNAKYYIEGKPVMAALEEMSKDPMRYNTEFLMKLLDDNKNTEYGKKYGFADIKTVEDFQKRVPVSTFDDYAGFIYRMTEEGETNLITAYDVPHYAKTSGTMGNPKRIPVSERGLYMMNRYNLAGRNAIMIDGIGTEWINEPFMNLIESQCTTLKNGASYGAISAKVIRELGPNLSQFMSSPEEAMIPDPRTNTRYLHARFGLMNGNIGHATFVFSSIMLELMQYIEKDWELLVRDIENGTIDDSIKMPAEVRESVLAKIQPMPERAAELRAIFEQGFDEPFVPKVWPNMIIMSGTATGGFAAYYQKLKDRYLGNDIKLLYLGLNASEGLMSVAMELDDPNTVLIPDSIFYEFLPVESDDFNDIVTLDKVEVGKTYELIITNLSGFYRYRIRDAVKIMGKHNETPTIQFQYRIDQTINVMGEKTTELALRNALAKVEADLDFSSEDFSVFGDENGEPLRYTFLIESKLREGLTREMVEDALDADLCERNPSYGQKIEKGILAKLELRILQPETYLLYRDLAISKGTAAAQLKPPRILSNEIHRKFFMALLDEDQR